MRKENKLLSGKKGDHILASNPGIDQQIVEEAEMMNKAIGIVVSGKKTEYRLNLPFADRLINQPSMQNVVKKKPA